MESFCRAASIARVTLTRARSVTDAARRSRSSQPDTPENLRGQKVYLLLNPGGAFQIVACLCVLQFCPQLPPLLQGLARSPHEPTRTALPASTPRGQSMGHRSLFTKRGNVPIQLRPLILDS